MVIKRDGRKVDFDKNKIMLYNIKSNSTIINLTDENIELKSNFNGVLINNIELQIDTDKDCFINEFYGNINKKISRTKRRVG